MQISSSPLSSINVNYSIKLNDKEVLIYEDDPLKTEKKSDNEKRLEKEQKATNEKEVENTQELSEDEKRLVSDLQSRDAEVKAHESAHQSGGGATGAASYTYQQGPDGKMYAIGGEVSISFQTGSTPQETITNAQAVISSALAPADPSGQDMAVASSAMLMMMKAQQQLTRETQEENLGQETYKKEANKSENSSQKKSEIDIPA